MDILLRVADIIATDMELDDSRVIIYGQNYTAPTDSELYIIVKQDSQKILGSKNVFDPDTNEEVKTVNCWANINIDVISKNGDAYDRKEEVIQALTCAYSELQQELYTFKLFRASGDILDLSFISGAANLYRFRIPIVATFLQTKRTVVDYYDRQRQFQTEVNRR